MQRVGTTVVPGASCVSTADVPRSSRVCSLAVPRSYRGHQEYVACQHSRKISNEGLVGVFLRRRKSGAKMNTCRRFTAVPCTELLHEALVILNMRAVSCRTVDADDISADRAVSSRRNGQHRGHNLHGRRVRVHEPHEHLGVADVAGRRVLPSRCHLSHSHNKRHWPPTSPKPPVTGRFTVNAVRQEPRRGPELVPDDSVPFGTETAPGAASTSACGSFSTGPPALGQNSSPAFHAGNQPAAGPQRTIWCPKVGDADLPSPSGSSQPRVAAFTQVR